MKTFGLYCNKENSGVLLRVIDGSAEIISAAAVTNVNISQMWESITNAKGTPAPKDALASGLWVPLYGGENVARMLYRVPANVEILF